MTQLTNEQISSVYGDLLTTTNSGQGLSNVLKQVQDGFGNASPISISQLAVNFDRSGGRTFQLDSTALTASASDINAMCNPNPAASGNGGLSVPHGTTGQRPINPPNGTFRYNDTTGRVEVGFNNNTWVNIT